ncbi:C-GCAxxG-C-C family protein [Hydrogenimonas thermophila]|uniref:C-GCAxxG-C-C family protein n=1 Tax=Hydrogenimonas thermophila TaxID=223786 RepID=UPI002936D556|nr:C-GCAxxG-C-C family protein [Hydrogenimonas thermophila]WOE68985.1 C-GCAxxG-C-C family protein [Hydrogenimonas thermophila]WOE71493.1 C-GCAxxG-C-C family protein [Hydrogenimonas thermophila]
MDRRNFLENSFKVGLGMTVGMTANNAIASNEFKNSSESKFKIPYPYKKIDPEKVAHKAYKYYRVGECCFAAFGAIMDELRESVGEPYTYIPNEMFFYGAGGGNGWGTLCGTLNGASAVITLVTGKEYSKIIDSLYEWYSTAQLPDYVPHNKEAIVTTKPELPLCHVSVMNWCKASGYAYDTKERSERCARLAGSVARKTAELLNAWSDQKLKDISVNAGCKTKMNCMMCHSSGLLPKS